jgi:sulfur-carrier protein
MASATIEIPSAFRTYTAGARELVVEATTVREAVTQLAARYPPLARHLLTPSGSLRTFVSVYVNGRDIRALRSDATELRAGDALTIVPAVAGG